MLHYHLTTHTGTSRGIVHGFLAGTALALAGTGVSPALAEPSQFDPLSHRAVYELSLIESERDSGVEDAGGLYIFEVDGSVCAGWTLSSDMVLSIQGQAGGTIRTQTSYRAFEDGAGEVFTFQTNTETVGEDPIAVTGAAERQTEGGLAIRRFAEEETTTSAIAETLFPNQLTDTIMAAALAGERLVFSTVFDGSHQSGLAQSLTAIIGNPQTPTVLSPLQADSEEIAEDGATERLDDFPVPTQAWPVRLSYFDPLDPDSAPSFIVSYTLDTNGVADQLVLDYGAFTLRGVLAGFEPLPSPSCPD